MDDRVTAATLRRMFLDTTRPESLAEAPAPGLALAAELHQLVVAMRKVMSDRFEALGPLDWQALHLLTAATGVAEALQSRIERADLRLPDRDVVVSTVKELHEVAVLLGQLLAGAMAHPHGADAGRQRMHAAHDRLLALIRAVDLVPD